MPNFISGLTFERCKLHIQYLVSKLSSPAFAVDKSLSHKAIAWALWIFPNKTSIRLFRRF